jgi:hypothetical protein
MRDRFSAGKEGRLILQCIFFLHAAKRAEACAPFTLYPTTEEARIP